MTSLYQDLAARLRDDPAPRRTGGPRYDIGVLLFNYRDDLDELYRAAERQLREPGDESAAHLAEVLERLRPFFGDR